MWYQHWYTYLFEVKGVNAAMSCMYARERAHIKPSDEILDQIDLDEPNVFFMPLG